MKKKKKLLPRQFFHVYPVQPCLYHFIRVLALLAMLYSVFRLYTSLSSLSPFAHVHPSLSAFHPFYPCVTPVYPLLYWSPCFTPFQIPMFSPSYRCFFPFFVYPSLFNIQVFICLPSMLTPVYPLSYSFYPCLRLFIHVLPRLTMLRQLIHV